MIGQCIGTYTIEALLGRSGMGSVWLARRSDGRFEGQVAIKLLERRSVRPDTVAQLRHVASLLARLSHANIARLLDAGVREDGQPYLILERVEGLPIDRYCREHRLPLKRRLNLLLEVLDAVAQAHSQLIVHRDIKPSNVLVTAAGVVKLLNFGVAAPELTPAYAEAEQIRGEPASTSADVYSLGVLLQVLITQDHPHEASDPAVTQRPDATPPVPASMRVADPVERRQVRGDLDLVIAHAVEPDPARRYPSVAALAADIRAWLSNHPVRARPTTRLYVIHKFVRRHRVAVFAVVLAVVMLAGASVVTALQLFEARREHAFALAQLGRAEAIDDFNFYIINDSAPAGQVVTLPDLMARAENVLEREQLVDASRVSLLTSVGWEYETQDDHAKGLKILTEAYRLSRHVADPAARAEAACRLANALADESPTPRSSQLIDEGLRELPRTPEYALERSNCLRRGAEVAWRLGDAQLAVQRMQDALKGLNQVPFDHEATDLRAREGLANALNNAGRHREAIAIFADTWTRTLALGRDGSAAASNLLNNWALALTNAGRPLDAEPIQRRAIELAPSDDVVLRNYAVILSDIGRTQEASSYGERATRAAIHTNNPRSLGTDKQKWADALRVQHDRSRAEQLLDEAEPLLRRSLPPGHYLLAAQISIRALLAQDRGQFRDALALISQALQICEQADRRGQTGAQYIPDLLGRRALIEIDAVSYADAEVDARRALKVLNASPDEYSSYGGRAYLALGRVLAAQGRSAEARESAREALRQLDRALGPDAPETRAARQLVSAKL